MLNVKKVIAVAAAVAVVALTLFFVFSFKGSDGVTVAELSKIKNFYEVSPFKINEDTGMAIYPKVVALSGCDGSNKNTFLGTKTAINSNADIIEVRVAANPSSGTLVLADNIGDIKTDSTEFRRAVELAANDSSFNLLIHLSEYNNLNSVYSQLNANKLRTACYISGISENALAYVARFFPNYKLLCDYGKDNEKSFEEIKKAGAYGVICSAADVNAKTVKAAHETGLEVWVNGIESNYLLLKAVSDGVDGLMTTQPEDALSLSRHWSYDSFKSYVKGSK